MCWLEKRIIGFRQDIRSFLCSKTNQVALTTLVGAAVGYSTGELSAMASMQLALPAVFALTIRDAMAPVAKRGGSNA